MILSKKILPPDIIVTVTTDDVIRETDQADICLFPDSVKTG